MDRRGTGSSLWRGFAAAVALAGGVPAAVAQDAQPTRSPPFANQDGLRPVLNSDGGRTLRFDWPMLSIGTGEYEEGPTGVTVFRFGRKVHGAVDVRGGAPGTVNTDFLRLGYETPDLDAVVFAGGSWYGLEATTAVDTALKDDGVRSGYWDNIGLAVGAIIYDFGGRRLNEIYPDKRLAQAALRAARPGIFPLGARGAGRSAMTGSLFGCDAHSGQGGAFRQVGPVKIAAFTVVNAFGAVTDRDGKLVACYPDPAWPKDVKTSQLLTDFSEKRLSGLLASSADKGRKNTTVSLVVTNVKMSPAELQRLAIQVHSSMARGIQPFQTMFDGDVLYAVSTDEVDPGEATLGFGSVDVATLASEAMWDAILASVPPQPAAPVPAKRAVAGQAVLEGYAGDYRFSPIAELRVTAREGKLFGEATGKYDIFSIKRGQPVELLPVTATDFTVPGRYPMLLRFDGNGMLTVNPGSWQQVAQRTDR
ncbi:P1 family peptidase [Sphingomonas cannabina]|uniref:P1 family peptidase n=1 Tax=Sphingomonas cannabina TaxID=2899123 RepID=UPI001F4278FA|nr:P1 family peptidase [Sphingomonas cannabina]UIJ45672.1 P1 family peptidase [Sphingomonas cannabina]